MNHVQINNEDEYIGLNNNVYNALAIENLAMWILAMKFQHI